MPSAILAVVGYVDRLELVPLTLEKTLREPTVQTSVFGVDHDLLLIHLVFTFLGPRSPTVTISEARG